MAGVDGGVAWFDPRTGRKDGSVVLDGRLCGAPDAGFGSLWYPACNPCAIHRVDATTGERLATIPLDLPPGGEFAIGAGAGGVWAVLGPVGVAGRLARIDPTTDRVDQVIEIPPGAASVRVAQGSLWVAFFEACVVRRVAPAIATVLDTFETGAGPRFLVGADDGVWVVNQGAGSVTHLDASRGIVDTVAVDAGPMHGGDVCLGAGSVWVRGTSELVTRIDAATHRVTGRYGAPTQGSASVTVAGDQVWATAGAEGWLIRFPIPAA